MESNKKIYRGVNWNTLNSDYVMIYWEQNIKQFWVDSEYTPSRDIDSWRYLDPTIKNAYKKALGGLTMLDTLQSGKGMPSILTHIKDLQKQAVLSFMCMMESIHAKSYSTIFTTVANTDEINDTFKWVENNKHLQYKASKIDEFYSSIIDNDNVSLYKALGASVMLESFLFYSGFFLPLWLCGNGEMVASADIIKKIIADESIHGSYVGLLAQEVYEKLTESEQNECKEYIYKLLEDLIDNEFKYTDEVYAEIGLTSDVKTYVKYNANKALNNLGYDAYYDNIKVNPIVLNGLNTNTTQHDFFSKKSTNYEKPTEIVYLKDEDFILNYDEIFK